MIQSLNDFFRKTFQFRGRATRKDYWLPTFALVVASVLIRSLNLPRRLEDVIGVLSILPSISLTSRRYQDAGVSGWFQLPQLLSFLLLPLVFMNFVAKWMKAVIITVIALFNTVGFILTLLPSDKLRK
ncbi:DUF805 domain-containing protein [Salinicoccus halitifaciens]|uniref:Uncharacterized membrane protein YhaH (DUF805 family) n=1 Tax=Salinicoccus halitifaciens TaxID=1073415 RepID=A0ABV2ECR3_9STAP|nr:DUF805 domain-containing protein [Salinicoccus halitifaciens]MCD2137399.1 DUF805 domain-containing protein [Salinicoccus halitifaciens]